jgi:hypothetical protein
VIRLTWRLARPNLLSSAALLGAVVVFAVLTRRAMTGYLEHSGLNACLAAGGDCERLARGFDVRFEAVINSYGWISLVPMLAGVFWGAPLIARELEQGTHRLAWTQSISRQRWLAAKLGVFLLGALAVAAVVTQVMTWWFTPIEKIREGATATFGRLNPDVFDFRGIVPAAYTFFAFAVGVAAGTIFRRTLPAMLATLVVYIPVKSVLGSLRAHYEAPLNLTYAIGSTSPRATRGDWIIAHDVVDGAGRTVDRIPMPDACRVLTDHGAADACLASHGFRFVDTYQPVERFWSFQFIEAGLFVGFSVLLLAFAAGLISRRVG